MNYETQWNVLKKVMALKVRDEGLAIEERKFSAIMSHTMLEIENNEILKEARKKKICAPRMALSKDASNSLDKIEDQ